MSRVPTYLLMRFHPMPAAPNRIMWQAKTAMFLALPMYVSRANMAKSISAWTFESCQKKSTRFPMRHARDSHIRSICLCRRYLLPNATIRDPRDTDSKPSTAWKHKVGFTLNNRVIGCALCGMTIAVLPDYTMSGSCIRKGAGYLTISDRTV